MKQPNIWIGTPEDIGEGIDDGHLQRPGGVFMVIGERGLLTRQQARRMGTQWQKFMQRYPEGVFAFSIDGYDDDPRDLWEIPEVSKYIQQWARFAGMDDYATAARFVGPTSASGRQMPQLHLLGLLAACGVFGEEIKATVIKNKVPRDRR